jgi:hypothetical protein
MNFFNWIRDGVRHAVLLGVSDAVQDIGTPESGEDIGNRLLERMRNGQPALVHEMPGSGAPGEHKQQRKKLGRSLEQIQAGAAKTA